VVLGAQLHVLLPPGAPFSFLRQRIQIALVEMDLVNAD
jgi:hypothetical protein